MRETLYTLGLTHCGPQLNFDNRPYDNEILHTVSCSCWPVWRKTVIYVKNWGCPSMLHVETVKGLCCLHFSNAKGL